MAGCTLGETLPTMDYERSPLALAVVDANRNIRFTSSDRTSHGDLIGTSISRITLVIHKFIQPSTETLKANSALNCVIVFTELPELISGSSGAAAVTEIADGQRDSSTLYNNLNKEGPSQHSVVSMGSVDNQEVSHNANNMFDRITDDLNFLLNGSTEDMMTFTPAHLRYQEKQKLPTIQENMVGISEELERKPASSNKRE